MKSENHLNFNYPRDFPYDSRQEKWVNETRLLGLRMCGTNPALNPHLRALGRLGRSETLVGRLQK